MGPATPPWWSRTERYAEGRGGYAEGEAKEDERGWSLTCIGRLSYRIKFC